MGLVRTFIDYAPDEREDGIPFSSVEISEAASKDGIWSVIDTQVLPTPDADPANPQVRAITTTEGTIEEGWYKLRFLDSSGGYSNFSEPVQFGTAYVDYEPSVEDIGALLRARTVDIDGNELGTFTDETRPSAEQVGTLIKRATDIVEMRVGTIPVRLYDKASSIIALLTAYYIELSYFPEQADTDQSAATQYLSLFNASMAALEKAAADDEPVSDTGGRWGTITALGSGGYETSAVDLEEIGWRPAAGSIIPSYWRR